MLVDWFTVIAQIANFLILVWLMKRYLYQPIFTAIDAREKRIAAQLSEAKSKANDAAKERDLFQQKNQQFDQERDKLMKKTQDSAEAEKRKLMDAARQEVEAMRTKGSMAVLNERKTLERELAVSIQHEAFAIARQALASLANVDLETQITTAFIEHLKALDTRSKAALLAAVNGAPQTVQVRSVFDLGQAERQAIRQALNVLTGTELTIQFDVSPNVGCGIELSINGQKLAWSVAGYLHSLDSHVNHVLDSVASDSAKPESSTKSSV
ncbi:F0F1 ATP synthase subunit B [Undibacterium sp. RuRC25W]|uniref:F0F1 ATP synthase subunit B family protein n=1 Tax=Undibacterium sp. RuRC25W TaxID=3413047 RepID=UPI003BF4230B